MKTKQSKLAAATKRYGGRSRCRRSGTSTSASPETWLMVDLRMWPLPSFEEPQALPQNDLELLDERRS